MVEMELLPIIYWTLVSVGILAFFVIIFSFISYHFRKRMGKIPIKESSRKGRDIKVKVTNPHKREDAKKSHHPKVQTRSRSKSNDPKEKIRTTSSNKSSSKLYSRSTQHGKKSRIEIINAPKEDLNYHLTDPNPIRREWD